MTSRSVLRALLGLMIAAVLAASVASAAPPPPGRASTAGDVEAQARALAEKGAAHFDDGEYREALEALQRSLDLVKKRGVMALAASCLRQLGRYDEALSLYEEVLREFPDPDPRSPFRKKVDEQIAALQGLVGTLVVVGDAPDGATLFVDDRRIGVLPLAEPLRLSVGTHRIRVEKERFEPISATVEVNARQESVAQLVATSRKGRLVVRERHNWTLYVEIDGKNVGVTPWEGLVEVGARRVRLHGLVDLDALEEDEAPEAGPVGKAEVAKQGAKVASAVQTATVPLYETTPMMLRAVELDASLRIESEPGGARLWIDGKEIGRTPWAGRLSLGEHVIEVGARGFVSATQSVRLERRKQRELKVVLKPFWQTRPRPPRYVAEAVTSVALVPSFGGDVVGACTGECAQELGTGGSAVMHAGYELGAGLGFGVTAGYLAAAQDVTGRSATITPTGLEPNSGTVDDRLALRGALLGGWIGLSLVDSVPLRFRLGAGVLVGSLLDERSNGEFESGSGTGYTLGDFVQRHPALFFHTTPEVRAALRLGKRVEVSAGVAVPVLIGLEHPRWDDGQVVPAGPDGSGTFPTDRLTSQVLVVITPGIGARYDF